ncbi:HEXXH motif domain-containing protein [Thermopolyspora sp. NPDC052614]|uniref:HEXXH motif domain-containing protein n=1 Tax=Thermopolyspora sp. NPDC052614 TaxID=3155682 RepID=UPI00344813E0
MTPTTPATPMASPAPEPHTLPGELFDLLAAGGGGARAVHALAAGERSRRLLVLRDVVATARAGHADAEVTGRAYALLGELARAAPAALDEVISYPAVGAWALITLRRLVRGDPEADPARLAAIAAAVAARGRIPSTITVRATRDGVMLPSLGLARFPGAYPGQEAVVRVTPATTVVVLGDRTVPVPRSPRVEDDDWLGLCRIAVGAADRAAELVLDDVDPYRFPAFPTRGRCAPRLPADRVDRWRRVIGAGDRLLTGPLAYAADELRAGTRMLVPLVSPRIVSASSSLSIGCVALSLPPSPLAAARTLMHEMQHGKLSALMTLFPLIAEPTDERFYAPWRDDPRPLAGLFQGAYAHLGIARFWARRCEVETEPEAALYAQTELARWRRAALETTEVLLRTRRFTALGERFLRGMRASLTSLARIPVAAAAEAAAAALSARHRTRWLRAHGADADASEGLGFRPASSAPRSDEG